MLMNFRRTGVGVRFMPPSHTPNVALSSLYLLIRLSRLRPTLGKAIGYYYNKLTLGFELPVFNSHHKKVGLAIGQYIADYTLSLGGKA